MVRFSVPPAPGTMPPPNETNPPEDPATRLARIQDWSFQSGQAYKEIKWLRDFLRDKDGDEFADALRRVERVKKYVFFAGQMTPEPPPPPEADESDDEYDEQSGIDALQEHLGYLNMASQEAEEPADEPSQTEIQPASQTSLKSWTSLEAEPGSPQIVPDPATHIARNEGVPHTYGGQNDPKWLDDVSEEDRLIYPFDLQELRENGELKDHPEADAYMEEIIDNILPYGTNPNIREAKAKCRLCFEKGKLKFFKMVSSAPNEPRKCSMLTHIRKSHKDLFRTPRRCGCDGRNRKNHPDPYLCFYHLNAHLKERTSIHYKTRQEQL